jgi:hypothetical protein
VVLTGTGMVSVQLAAPILVQAQTTDVTRSLKEIKAQPRHRAQPSWCSRARPIRADAEQAARELTQPPIATEAAPHWFSTPRNQDDALYSMLARCSIRNLEQLKANVRSARRVVVG